RSDVFARLRLQRGLHVDFHQHAEALLRELLAGFRHSLLEGQGDRRRNAVARRLFHHGRYLETYSARGACRNAHHTDGSWFRPAAGGPVVASGCGSVLWTARNASASGLPRAAEYAEARERQFDRAEAREAGQQEARPDQRREQEPGRGDPPAERQGDEHERAGEPADDAVVAHGHASVQEPGTTFWVGRSGVAQARASGARLSGPGAPTASLPSNI